MSRTEPKYRRPLSEQQLTVLKLLYQFRFGSSDLFAKCFGKPSGKYVQKRLRILEDQGYIAKRYDKSYKLLGKPAAYYLLAKAAKLLQSQYPTEVPAQAIKNRYKDKTASDKFMNHCLGNLAVFIKLRALYGSDRLQYLTNSTLSLERFDYFPKWLPDAHITLKVVAKGTGKRREFFLDVLEDTIPFFVRVRRIKSYLTYAQSEEWDGELPTILMVCETQSTQKRLRRRIAKELGELGDEDVATFYTTTKQELDDSTKQADRIWQLATEPEVMRSMGEM